MGAARAALDRWRECLPGVPAVSGTPETSADRFCAIYPNDDPGTALAHALETLADGGSVALIDPALPAARLPEVEATLQQAAARAPGACSLATGGSSGQWRLARHRVDTLWAAAEAFTQRFPRLREHWSPLPAFHVSGWMPLWRAMACRGEMVPADYRDWLNGRFPRQPSEGAVLSLVPTQLHRLMECPGAVAFLRRFTCILVGGAALNDGHRQRARELQIPLAPSYGMTETAAAIAVLPPANFLAGAGGCGPPLPHVDITFETGTGRLILETPSLFDGYLTHNGFAPRPGGPWPTADRASLDEAGNLHILGRIDRMIATGGEKVAPDRLESALRKIPGVRDVLVFGLPDAEWGEIVAAAVETVDPASLRRAWRDLSKEAWHPAERPRRWWITDQLPRNAIGKIQRASLIAESTRFTREP